MCFKILVALMNYLRRFLRVNYDSEFICPTVIIFSILYYNSVADLLVRVLRHRSFLGFSFLFGLVHLPYLLKSFVFPVMLFLVYLIFLHVFQFQVLSFLIKNNEIIAFLQIFFLANVVILVVSLSDHRSLLFPFGQE